MGIKVWDFLDCATFLNIILLPILQNNCYFRQRNHFMQRLILMKSEIWMKIKCDHLNTWAFRHLFYIIIYRLKPYKSIDIKKFRKISQIFCVDRVSFDNQNFKKLHFIISMISVSQLMSKLFLLILWLS